MSAGGPDHAAVRNAVATVPDPELPAITIGDLGMLHDLRISGGRVEVELLPTFAGCPATDVIGDDVTEAALGVPGVREVAVRFRLDPPWTTGRISPAGRERLRSFGIAPPAEPPPNPLPLLATVGPAVRACPYCASTETEVDSAFGPTPCRSIHYCRSCRQPFEAFKSL